MQENIFRNLTQRERDAITRADLPKWVDPMLAKLTRKRFSDENWIFERKLDGERCLAFLKNGSVRLMSRNKKRINHSYPELVRAFSGQALGGCIADGEIVAFEGNRTSFSRLQNRMHVKDPQEVVKSGIAVYLYLFDLIHLHGYDLTGLPLRSRKSLLKSAFRFDDPLRYTPHRNEHGEKFYRQACERGWEGVIAKNAESTYVHSRSGKWLKFKCTSQQELVIGGYTPPQGERQGLGALLVGYYEQGKLQYAGKVGTGFSAKTLRRLSKELKSRERGSSPFSEDIRDTAAIWVRPELVGEIGFTEWTSDGKLRHPRFLGLRRDKDPEKVTRERNG